MKDPEAAKRRPELLENAIKDKMLKIDESGRQLKKYLFREGGAG